VSIVVEETTERKLAEQALTVTASYWRR